MGRRICGALFLILALSSLANAEVIYRPLTLWLAHDAADGINCIVNLREISFAARVWRAEHGQFPSGFEVLTNELTSPARLCCPANHRAPCPSSFSDMNWDELDYEWLTGFDPNDEQSVFSQCRIHGNVARVNGLTERLFGFRNGWPAVIAAPMDVSATTGATVRFEVRLAPTTLQPVQFQWERVEYVRKTNVVFVTDPDFPGAGYWRTNTSSEARATAIPGANDPVYTILNVSSNDAKYYRVSMSNAMGTAMSSGRLIAVSNLPNPQADAEMAKLLCTINLRGIGMAARIWANDTQRLPGSFAEMTNQYGSALLGWPLILYCPWDTNRVPAAEWEDVDLADVSYELIQPTPDVEDGYGKFCRCKVHGFYVEVGGAVITSNGPPRITRQPQSQTVFVGSYVSLYVGVSGPGPFTFQWRKAGTNLIGETESGYWISPAEPQHAGNYDVVISNAFGEVTSSNAVVTVRAPLILRDPRITAAGLFECVVLGPAHYSHVIESSTDLTSWTPVTTNVTSTSGISVFQDAAPPNRKFYRAVEF